MLKRLVKALAACKPLPKAPAEASGLPGGGAPNHVVSQDQFFFEYN